MSSPEKHTTERITWIKPWTPHLFSFRCTRSPGYRFTAGQWARLGVLKDGADKPVWRAYSMVSAPHDEFLEFYSIVVPGGEFTSELARLQVGDSLLVDKTNFGFLTTDRFEGGSDLWLLSTGTGIAPFISILHDPAVWERFARIVLVHSVREAAELAYQDTIEALKTHEFFGEFAQKLTYVRTVTREAVPGCLAGRITSLIPSGELEAAAGLKFSTEASRVMICGNPQMVEDTREVLGQLGLKTSRRGAPGQLALENYW
ncbi:ferredoxin--NADP reductase [Piscinibacterium candidicorallinum]|uniref:ferredoxin--NADP(+) reductase n=1 Tax=Piscinibacterium candidicorallinum TaxID=1793872 RepID=A0ABV7H3P7_9BURK